MVLQAASIVFNDSASQFNKDLTDFLRRNLETAIRKGGLTFHFKIAKAADLAGLRQMGVKRLPAMIISGKPYVGVPDIIAEIRARVKNSRFEAAEKTEDEIVRDYQIQALGHITKDAEGRLQVHDEPERDDSQYMMAKFNREIQRRGAAAGHAADNDDLDGPPQRMQRPPPQPSRDVDRDMEEDDEPRRPAGRQAYAPARPPARPDNLDNPNMGDAFESLQRIGRNATAEDAKDDEMMGALLARMGGD